MSVEDFASIHARREVGQVLGEIRRIRDATVALFDHLGPSDPYRGTGGHFMIHGDALERVAERFEAAIEMARGIWAVG